jgi:hypothetical protein
LGTKSPLAISLTLFNQNQSLPHPGPSAHGKHPYAVPPEKCSAISLASQHHSCLHETAKETGEHYTPQGTILPTPCKNNPTQTLGRLNSPTAKLKNITKEL